MPVLPLIDLLLLMGWTSLVAGAVMKGILVTTHYRPYILTLGPLEFLWISALFMLFALALAARTWVKANEPEILAKQRRVSTLHSVATESEEYDVAARSASPDAPMSSEALGKFPVRDLTGP